MRQMVSASEKDKRKEIQMGIVKDDLSVVRKDDQLAVLMGDEKDDL